MNLYLVSLLIPLHYKFGIQKLSVASVTLNCLDHLALSVPANLAEVLLGLGVPMHIQISKTSAEAILLWQLLVMTYFVTGSDCKIVGSQD